MDPINSNPVLYTASSHSIKVETIKRLNNLFKSAYPMDEMAVIEVYLDSPINNHVTPKDLFNSEKLDFESVFESGDFKGLTLLAAAARMGFIHVAKFLIEECPNASLLNHVNPIIFAAIYGHTDVVKLLIDHGVDCNFAIPEGEHEGLTPLYVAAYKGFTQIVELLINAGVDPSFGQQYKTGIGPTPIFAAARNGQTDIVKLLIKKGVDCESGVQCGDCIGETPFYVAAARGHLEIVNLLIQIGVDYKSPIFFGHCQGETPIFAAAAQGRHDVVELLIRKGVDYKLPILFGDSKGITPVCAAAANGHRSVVKLLIDYLEANFNIPNQSGIWEGRTPIYAAANNGETDVVELLIEYFKKYNLNPNTPLKWGMFKGLTPLYAAASEGRTEVVKLLIGKGVNFEAAIASGNAEGVTPIYIAAKRGQTEVVELLINHGVDSNQALSKGEMEGETPLFVAVINGHTKVVELLLKKGKVDPNFALQRGSYRGFTPIYAAANGGYIEIVKLLIAYDVDCKSPLLEGPHVGQTPIFTALCSDNFEVVQLLSDKVDLNLPIQFGSNEGQTLIYAASIKGSAKIVKLLIQKGVNFNLALQKGKSQGLTPIYSAAASGQTEVVKLLIEKKADFHSPIQVGSSKGYTPLIAAACKGHTDVVQLLIDNKADYHAPTQTGINSGISPIQIAAFEGQADVVKLLIENKVDFHSPIKDGRNKGLTAIFAAAYNGHYEIVRFLIDRGVDFKSPIKMGNFQGITPIFSAASKGYLDIVKLLIDNGVDYNLPVLTGEFAGNTPVFAAARSGFSEVVKLLVKNDVFLKYHELMSSEIAEICQNAKKLEKLILELLIEADDDKQFSFKWIVVDNFVYLSMKPSSPVFFQGRSFLESKGIKVETSKNKEELWIKKSQANQLKGLLVNWKKTCKLIELIQSNLFEKRLFEQATFDDQSLILNFRPFDVVIFRRIIADLNGRVEKDGRVFIPLELISRIDVNFKELKKSANLNAEKLNRVINLAKTHGKAKVVYADKDLQITFKDEQLLNSFIKAIPKCTRTENQLEVRCLYDDILDGELLPLAVKLIEPSTAQDRLDNKTKCIASFQKALEPLISNYKIWCIDPDFIEADLGSQFLASLAPLNITGLELQPRLRIKTEDLEKFSEEDFNRIASDVKVNHGKIVSFERISRKVSTKDNRFITDQGYVFCFKDEKHKTCFETQLQNVIEPADGENQFLMKYSKILELDQEQLNMLLKKLEELKPVVQVVRPAQPIQIANNNNAIVVAAVAKKSQKKKKKNHGNQAPSSESKPSAVAKAIDSYKGPKIAPQPQQRGLMPRLEREYCVWGQATLEIDYTSKPVKPVPVVVLMNKKVPLNDYEACIKHELEFLKGLSTWYNELEINSKSQFSEIYCDSLWLGLLRFYNAVFLRAKNTKNIVSLSENDMDARKIRACLIHFFRDKKSLESHYQRYILKSMGPIVDNDYKIPDVCHIENLSNCLLLQDCKAIADFTPIVKEQFQSIVEYLNILKTKAEKQIKVLSDVFQCAVEGDLADSDFRFLVHEAKAIEACLVKLGELHRHIKDSPGIADEVKRFTAKCRKLRNRITHEAGQNYPVTAETISKFAEEAKSLYGELFI